MRIVFRFLVVLGMITFCFGLSGFSNALAEEEKLTFGTNIRLRYEFQDNFNQKFYGDNPGRGSSDDGFLLGRFRTGFDYSPSKKIHFALWIQDSEVWDIVLPDSEFYKGTFGIEHNPNKDRWELWDTYLEVQELFDLPITFKGGRQRIFYGNKRIFGPGQWGNTGRWIWDATKLSYKFKGGFMDAYYGRTQLHEPGEFSLNHRHGFESAGFYSRFQLPKKFFNIALEPFFMTKDDDHNRLKGEDGRNGDLDSYYLGLRSCRKDIKGFDYDFTYICQRGDFAHDDIKAYGYHLLLAYNFKKMRIKPRISIEYSFGSGDSDPNDGDHETFDGAFGARDKMYGRMNLFHWKNIEDAQVNLEIKPNKWFYLNVGFHKFWLAEDKDAWYLNQKKYRDKAGRSGDEVGKELDIIARFNLPRKNQIQVGFGHFWPDEFAEEKASHKQANWVFFQWMYQFSWGIL
ncbi:MAG: alginate export family protein [Thermodesulfobacteriota bacterium]|nr:alginate export family protein [Thermodesulfobacteriota bacterium]